MTDNNFKKNRTLALFFGLMPGAGHMYLGLLKQGLELMSLFLLGFFLTDWLNLSIFMLVVPLVWFYSFFDVLNKSSNDEPLIDEDIAIFSWFNGSSISPNKRSKMIAYALIAIGIISLLEKIVFPAIDRYINWEVRNYFQTGIISLLFIMGGIKLLMGTKRNLQIEHGDDKE